MLPADIAKILCEARQKAIDGYESAEWTHINNNLLHDLKAAAEEGLSTWQTTLSHTNNVLKLVNLISSVEGLHIETLNTQKGTRVTIRF